MPHVLLLSSRGVRFVNIPEPLPPIFRLPVPPPPAIRWADGIGVPHLPQHREFLRADDHTYVEREAVKK